MFWKERDALFLSLSLFLISRRLIVGLGLLIFEVSRSYSEQDTPHSVGIVWTSDQPDAATSTFQHTTLKRHKYP